MLQARSPSLQTEAGRELGRVCLDPSSVGDLEYLFRTESLPAPALPLFQRSSLSWNQWKEVFFHRSPSSNHRWSSCRITLGFAWDPGVCAPLPALPRDDQGDKGWGISTRLRTKGCCSSQAQYLWGIYLVLKATPVSHGICFDFLLSLQSNKEPTLLLLCPFSCFCAWGSSSSNCLCPVSSIQRRKCTPACDVKFLSQTPFCYVFS